MNCTMCKRELVTEAYYKIINKPYCFRCAERTLPFAKNKEYLYHDKQN